MLVERGRPRANFQRMVHINIHTYVYVQYWAAGDEQPQRSHNAGPRESGRKAWCSRHAPRPDSRIDRKSA